MHGMQPCCLVGGLRVGVRGGMLLLGAEQYGRYAEMVEMVDTAARRH